jgi:hypothetical protein
VSRRFFTGYPWRYLFTDLDCVTTTFAEGIVSNRAVVLGLGAAEAITGTVVPDDPRINTIWDDGYPKVAPLKRIAWAFRRDGSGETLWQPRAAGIIQQPSDHADDTVPVAEFTAYGPRSILAARPVLISTGSGFTLPGQNAAGGSWFYRMAGVERPEAIFAWDRLNRSVANIERMHDATPGSFFNRVQYFAGQGGFPVPPDGPLDNAESIDAFGVYWSTNFQPNLQQPNPDGADVLAAAEQALQLVKQGKRTMTITPIPERAPIPITGYMIGDRVPIYASARLRVTADGYQRVQTLPIQIDDDGIEHVNGFVATPDFATVGS